MLIKFRIYIFIFLIILAWDYIPEVTGKGIYQKPADFLEEVFGNPLPVVNKLWIENDIQENIQKILQRKLKTLRLRYWEKNDTFVYILEEIGKEKPITVGFVIRENKIEKVNILIFRETRGGEIRYPFFTDQFKEVSLVKGYKLDRKIDGISGATLSVNAVKRLARLSLYLYTECRLQAVDFSQ